MKTITKTLAKVLLTNAGTIRPNTLETPNKGFCVASIETQDLHGLVGFVKAYMYAIRNDMYFGWWKDTESGKVYFDATIVVSSQAEATAIATENNQIAFYSLDQQYEIRL